MAESTRDQAREARQLSARRVSRGQEDQRSALPPGSPSGVGRVIAGRHPAKGVRNISSSHRQAASASARAQDRCPQTQDGEVARILGRLGRQPVVLLLYLFVFALSLGFPGCAPLTPWRNAMIVFRYHHAFLARSCSLPAHPPIYRPGAQAAPSAPSKPTRHPPSTPQRPHAALSSHTQMSIFALPGACLGDSRSAQSTAGPTGFAASLPRFLWQENFHSSRSSPFSLPEHETAVARGAGRRDLGGIRRQPGQGRSEPVRRAPIVHRPRAEAEARHPSLRRVQEEEDQMRRQAAVHALHRLQLR